VEDTKGVIKRRKPKKNS